MSATFLKIALEELNEEFDGEQAQTMDVTQEEVAALESELEAVLAESQATSDDTSVAIKGAMSLEELAVVLDEAAGAQDEPLAAPTATMAGIALEAITGEEAGGQTSGTKASVIEALKKKASEIWKYLVELVTKIGRWVKQKFAEMTDAVAKNSARATKILPQAKAVTGTAFSKEVTDKALISALYSEGTTLPVTFKALLAFATSIGKRMDSTILKEIIRGFKLYAETGDLAGVSKTLQDQVTDTYIDLYRNPWTKNIPGVRVTDMFPGNHQATMLFSTKGQSVLWQHSISKIPVPEGAVLPVLSGSEMVQLVIQVQAGTTLIKLYQAGIAKLSAFEKVVATSAKAAEAKAKTMDKQSPETSKAVKEMIAMCHRAIKGPHIDAFALLTRSSSATLTYVEKSIAAYTAPAKKETAAA